MTQRGLGRREYLSEQRVPPSDHARVEMFLDLAADYADLDRTLTMPLTVSWGGEPPTEAERWTIVLHATLLRKFFSSDQVGVGQVVPAVRRLLRDSPDPELLRGLDAVEQYASAHDAPTPVSLHVGSLAISPWEAAQVQLHGRHIHSDYAKWHQSTGAHYGEIQYVQMWAVASALVIRPLVVNVRWAWRQHQFQPEVDLKRWVTDPRWGDSGSEPES